MKKVAPGYKQRRANLQFKHKKFNIVLVGAIGFEPTTYGTQNRRATRLRYAPTSRSLARIGGGEKRKRTSEPTNNNIIVKHFQRMAKARWIDRSAGGAALHLR
jgi:hypothetical protein